MATKYDVIRRPGVQLVQKDPMSGWEALASALGDYYSPEEIRARKADRRADARVELEQDRFDEVKEENDFNQEQARVENRRQAALDKRQTLVFNQGQEDREFNIAKENYDHTLNAMLKDKDVEGALEFLDTFNTSNARLSALAKQEAKNLGRKKTQLTSAINDLSTIAPGLTDKYSQASLMKTLWDNPNAIAETIMLSEIGEITKGREKEYESLKVILNSQLEQLKTALPGTPERTALLEEIEGSISRIREYGGINIPDGDGSPVVDVEDLFSDQLVETKPSSMYSPSGITDYISLVSQDSPDAQSMVSALAPKGELGILESAAGEGSVLVPVTKEVRKAVKGSLMDLRKGLSSVSDFHTYSSTKKDRESESYKKSITSLKNSLVNAMNLYNSIDPKSGRHGKGGQSERNKIKKQILRLKKDATKSRFIVNSIKHIDPEFLEMLKAISFEGKPSKKSKKKSRAKDVIIAGPENPLDLLLDLSEPADSTEGIPEMWLEPATEGALGRDQIPFVPTN